MANCPPSLMASGSLLNSRGWIRQKAGSFPMILCCSWQSGYCRRELECFKFMPVYVACIIPHQWSSVVFTMESQVSFYVATRIPETCAFNNITQRLKSELHSSVMVRLCCAYLPWNSIGSQQWPSLYRPLASGKVIVRPSFLWRYSHTWQTLSWFRTPRHLTLVSRKTLWSWLFPASNVRSIASCLGPE